MNVVSRSVPALATALLLLASGCGGADDPAAGTGTSATSSTTADTADLPEDACTLLEATDLSAALGTTVTTSTAPVQSCDFKQEDPRALSGSFGIVENADTNGGLPGYLSGVDATLTDPTTHDITGLSGTAVVKVGAPAMGSGENLMAAGALDRGSYLLQVTLVQGQGMPEAALADAAEQVLRLLDATP